MSDVQLTGGGFSVGASTTAPGGRVQSGNEATLAGSLAEEGGQQSSPSFSVVTDGHTIVGSGQTPGTELQAVGVAGPPSSPLVAGVSMPAGTPIYVDASGLAQPAKNDTLAHASAIGVLTTPAIAGQSVKYAMLEAVTLTVAAWSVVSGGALTPGASYYVGASAGQLVTSPPGGGAQVTRVGVAYTATTLLVNPSCPIVTTTP